MKAFGSILAPLLLIGCTPTPRTVICASDANGDPIAGLPLRVEFSDGLREPSLPSFSEVGAGKPRKDGEPILLSTDERGRASVAYSFAEYQPSDYRWLIFGADRVPNQSITITPLRDLPGGSSITVEIPNP